jgi:F-type H+-transporting ATPase subunit delta
MAKLNTGKRYAQAVFDLARKTGDFPGWQTSLQKIAGLLQDKKLLDLLENPRHPLSVKQKVLEEKIGPLPPLALNLALLLVSKGHLKRTPQILLQYQQFVDSHHGIEHALITTALPLSEAELKPLVDLLISIRRKKILLHPQVNPAILGGFKAKVSDTLIDGSLRQRLESLRKNLIE